MPYLSDVLTESTEQQKKQFFVTSVLLVALAALLRFYQLGDIPGPVFDEVYFPEYGYSYLLGKEFFHVHPPLYNYISTASIWLYHQLPWVDIAPLGSVEFKNLQAISYRWINAVVGTALVAITIALVFRLTKVKTAALIAGAFVAIDGSIVVDSRFGMNNIFLLFFGLLAIWATLKAHQLPANKRKWFFIAAVFFGCTICIKWNGLGYLLALLAFLMGLVIVHYVDKYRPALNGATESTELTESKSNNVNKVNKPSTKPKGLLSFLSFKPWEYFVYLLILPIVVYSFLWIPDRQFNTEYSFWGMQKQIMGYHSTMVTADEHPYCSKWYSWPVMERPIGYFFKTRKVLDEAGKATTYYTDVHLFANPAIYWFSTLAIIFMCGAWLRRTWLWFSQGALNKVWGIQTAILLGYFANLTPWALVERCAFLYHYQSASVFGFFALAWYLTQAIQSTHKWLKFVAVAILVIIVFAFIYWLPFVLGIELTQAAFYQRMWFQSWI